MSENAFFPLFVAAAFALAAALECPTVWRQALVFAPVLLAVGVRLQAIVLLVVVPAADRAIRRLGSEALLMSPSDRYGVACDNC
jgi:hypothetical protein